MTKLLSSRFYTKHLNTKKSRREVMSHDASHKSLGVKIEIKPYIGANNHY